MMIKHTGFVNLYNKDQKVFEKLFKDTRTLSQLTRKINRISTSYEELSYPDGDKVKGDLFEIFAECFFKILSADNRIGVYDYKPSPPIEDYGIDATGIGMDEKPLTVQVKFRSDATTELTQGDLSQFAFKSILEGVDKDTTTNMVVFTNARGLHWVTDQRIFSGRVRSIGYNEIRSFVDNNTVFWKTLNDMAENTIKEKYENQESSS